MYIYGQLLEFLIAQSDDKTRMELKYLNISKLERGKSV